MHARTHSDELVLFLLVIVKGRKKRQTEGWRERGVFALPYHC